LHKCSKSIRNTLMSSIDKRYDPEFRISEMVFLAVKNMVGLEGSIPVETFHCPAWSESTSYCSGVEDRV